MLYCILLLLYIIHYYIIIYYILYIILYYYYIIYYTYTIILYLILLYLYYTLLFLCSPLFPSPPYSSLPFLLFSSPPNLSSSQYSFYTCRYLHTVIYILSSQYSRINPVSVGNTSSISFPFSSLPSPQSPLLSSSSIIPLLLFFLLPNTLPLLPSSDSFYTCRYLDTLIYIQSVFLPGQFDPARSIGVDG